MTLLVWGIAALTLLLIILRPGGIPEAAWAAAGALAMVATRALSLPVALSAVLDGRDVYAFLIGMMVLAEIARERGVFAWFAACALGHARGSAMRLFTLVFAMCVAVTALLSNDATAVVATPSLLVIAQTADISPLPFLFASAFVANAASFVLPISNPANLLVFPAGVPPLVRWLAHLALPSVVAITLTYVLLRRVFARELVSPIEVPRAAASSARTRFAAVLLAAGSLALVAVSAVGGNLGVATLCVSAAIAFIVLAREPRTLGAVARGVMWSIVPLVGGLFVIVVALDRTGALSVVRHGVALTAGLPWPLRALTIGSASGLGANLLNNLPVALSVGAAVHGSDPPASYAALVGVNLGPNLAVSGSLASIMWLAILRRHGLAVNAATFLRLGIVVMPPTLLAALLTIIP